jgi:phosphoserine phosphatase RsbU/P
MNAVPPPPSPAPIAADAPVPVPFAQPLDSLQREINALHEEVVALKCRDEALKFHMHRLDEEMRLAARLQQDFLPKKLPQVGKVHFHTLFRPASFVSGDLYDVMRLDETHVGFYVADAVGHGMPAALLTMFMKNALLTKQITTDSYHLLPPGETLARLNDSLVAQNLSYATFATAIYGVVDTHSLRVTFARGGHPNPIILRSGGVLERLQTEGSLLGIFAGEAFPELTVQLATGDRMVVFTDGVELAFNDGTTIDSARWCDELWHRRFLPTEQLLRELSTRLDREADTSALKDDLTMVIVEVQ